MKRPLPASGISTYGCRCTGMSPTTPKAASLWKSAPPRRTSRSCGRAAGSSAPTQRSKSPCASATAPTRTRTRIWSSPATRPRGSTPSGSASRPSRTRMPRPPCWPWPKRQSPGLGWKWLSRRALTPSSRTRPRALHSSTISKRWVLPATWASGWCSLVKTARKNSCSRSGGLLPTPTTASRPGGAACGRPAGPSATAAMPTWPSCWGRAKAKTGPWSGRATPRPKGPSAGR